MENGFAGRGPRMQRAESLRRMWKEQRGKTKGQRRNVRMTPETFKGTEIVTQDCRSPPRGTDRQIFRVRWTAPSVEPSWDLQLKGKGQARRLRYCLCRLGRRCERFLLPGGLDGDCEPTPRKRFAVTSAGTDSDIAFLENSVRFAFVLETVETVLGPHISRGPRDESRGE